MPRIPPRLHRRGFLWYGVKDHTLAVGVLVCRGLIRDIKGVTLVAELSQE